MPVAGYGGRQKMTKLVTRNYWWPGVTKDIKKYMKGYDVCQRMKNRTEAPVENLMMNEVPEKPQTHLTVEFITKLPLVTRKNVILVVCNWLLKMVYFVVTTEEVTAEELARLFRNNMWKLYRLLESVISDRGLQFVIELTRELNKMLGIEMRLLTSFYLQMNRQIEWMNQELEQYLRFLTEYRQRDWPEWLVTAEFAVNNKVHIATKISPFMANYGRELRMGANIRRKENLQKE